LGRVVAGSVGGRPGMGRGSLWPVQAAAVDGGLGESEAELADGRGRPSGASKDDGCVVAACGGSAWQRGYAARWW
jgi:hypothetical protein